jgi:hypothetical protein
VDLQVNGKTIESTQPSINVARHFQLLSEMSINDLATIGHTLGFSPTLDNTKSMKYNSSSSTVNGSSGNGLTNNRPFAGVGDNQTAFSTTQNTGVGNTTGQYRCGKNKYMVWYDFTVIKLAHLFESLGKMGLVRRFDATLRLWVNTGTVSVTVASPESTNLNYLLTPNDNSFSNTCPLMVNYIPSKTGEGVPANTDAIVAGLYISKPPATSYSGGVNLANSGVAHPLGNCRLYYSRIVLDPQKSITYTNANLKKKVIYRTFVSNQYNNIAKNSSFNQFINSGIVHPTGGNTTRGSAETSSPAEPLLTP